MKSEYKIDDRSTLRSRFYSEWRTEFRPDAAILKNAGLAIGRTFIWWSTHEYEKYEKHETLLEIRNREQGLLAIEPYVPKRAFEIWKNANAYRVVQRSGQTAHLSLLEDVRSRSVWKLPIASARLALAYPRAFTYVAAIESNFQQPAPYCKHKGMRAEWS